MSIYFYGQRLVASLRANSKLDIDEMTFSLTKKLSLNLRLIDFYFALTSYYYKKRIEYTSVNITQHSLSQKEKSKTGDSTLTFFFLVFLFFLFKIVVSRNRFRITSVHFDFTSIPFLYYFSFSKKLFIPIFHNSYELAKTAKRWC